MQGKSVTIAKILQTKVSDVEHRCEPLYVASRYLGRSGAYVADKIRKHKHIMQAASGNWWAITRIDDQPVNLDKELEEFFASNAAKKNSLNIKTAPSPEAKAKRRRRIKYLLLLIDAKYGGIDQADNTPELLELRDLVNNGY